jgi:hypothetical protein
MRWGNGCTNVDLFDVIDSHTSRIYDLWRRINPYNPKEHTVRRSRRGLLITASTFLTFFAILVLITLMRLGAPATASKVDAVQATSAKEVGDAPLGRTAFEFTGRIDQDGPTFRIYGYVTYLYDLPPGLLFTQPVTHSEATARITLSGTTTLTDRSIISNVFHVDSAGTVSFYFDKDHGASFDDLDSFGRGQAIGAANVRLQNVLSVTGPNTGTANGSGEMIHTISLPFQLNGVDYKLGRPGMVQRVTFSGSGVRFVPEPPVSIIAIGGAGTVAGFDTFVPSAKK